MQQMRLLSLGLLLLVRLLRRLAVLCVYEPLRVGIRLGTIVLTVDLARASPTSDGVSWVFLSLTVLSCSGPVSEVAALALYSPESASS